MAKQTSNKAVDQAEQECSFSATTIAALLFLAAKFPHRQFNSSELCVLSGIGRTAMSQIKRHVLAKAQRSLRPELYARITEKLVFNRLNYDVQMEIARLHIARELSFLRDKGFELTLGHSVISFLMQRGFHPRLGARPLRDTVEKHLRGAVANAMLGGVGLCARELVVCDNELILQPSSPTR